MVLWAVSCYLQHPSQDAYYTNLYKFTLLTRPGSSQIVFVVIWFSLTAESQISNQMTKQSLTMWEGPLSSPPSRLGLLKRFWIKCAVKKPVQSSGVPVRGGLSPILFSSNFTHMHYGLPGFVVHATSKTIALESFSSNCLNYLF